jgi:hypothetical protein
MLKGGIIGKIDVASKPEHVVPAQAGIHAEVALPPAVGAGE